MFNATFNNISVIS